MNPFLPKLNIDNAAGMNNDLQSGGDRTFRLLIIQRFAFLRKPNVMTGSKCAVPHGYLYYRHSLPLRIMHWINACVLAVLLMSGLNIFNAHSGLYWGKSSYSGAPPFLELTSKENSEGDLIGVTRILNHEINTTGFLGASSDSNGELTNRGFPSWLTIPGAQWLALARRWHFFFAWLLVINGIVFMSYAIAGRHLKRDLLPTRQDWRQTGKTIIDHLRFRHPQGEAAKSYNVLQKLAYLGVIFLLLPLVILNGLGMSPALDALWPGWVDIFGGRQSMRTIHFFVAWTLVLFVMIHVFEVIVTGFWNNIRSMITGNYWVSSEANHGK
jgi:thiosulfate reductase cytochrome b subunit